MNLYRLRGKAEAFVGCGMIDILPVVTSNRTELQIIAKDFIKIMKKEKKKYYLYMEKLHIPATPSKEEWIQAFSSTILDDLISTVEPLKTWRNT